MAAAHGWVGEQYSGNVFAPDYNHQWDAAALSNEITKVGFNIISVKEWMYFGTLVAALASKIYRDLSKRKPESLGNGKATEKPGKLVMQSIYDMIDFCIPALSRRHGEIRIYNEAIVIAECLK